MVFSKKNGQQVSFVYHFRNIDDIKISFIQNLIDEIAHGNYDK